MVACGIVTYHVALISDNSTTTGLLTLAGVIVVALGTAYGIKLKSSGKISTTEATVLWQEAQDMRLELRAEVATLKEEVRVLKEDNIKIKADNIELREDNVELRRRIEELEKAHG